MPANFNGPDALRKLIEHAGNDFQPDAKHSVYKENVDLWRLYLDLYELDREKLKKLVERHTSDEDPKKYELRQKLAAVYNLIPMIVDMIGGYVFSETPAIDVGEDKELLSFLRDCDGGGLDYADFCKQTVLPMALVQGMIDVLVENGRPALGDVVTAKDAEKVRPHVVPIIPLQRINWSCLPNGRYQWVCFKDTQPDNADPFERGKTPGDSYITYSAARAEVSESGKTPSAFWVRSWRSEQNNAAWTHEGDFAPTLRAPLATLYYKRSNDPERRHFGLSKISQMAILTVGIVQVLSWTAEDVLANLALLAIPTRGGQEPTKTNEETGEKEPAIKKLTSFSTIYYDRESKTVPSWVQGNVSHIEIKLKIVEMHLREILRCAYLLSASGDSGGEDATSGGKSTSGRQSEIERSELFRELKEIAANLDSFTLDVLSLVKSWTTSEDMDAEQLQQKMSNISVNFSKGPYTLDPLNVVIENATAVIEMFRDVSPTVVEEAYKQTARGLIHSGGPALKTALKEIDTNTGKVMDERAKHDSVMLEAERQAAVAAAQTAAEEGDA